MRISVARRSKRDAKARRRRSKISPTPSRSKEVSPILLSKPSEKTAPRKILAGSAVTPATVAVAILAITKSAIAALIARAVAKKGRNVRAAKTVRSAIAALIAHAVAKKGKNVRAAKTVRNAIAALIAHAVAKKGRNVRAAKTVRNAVAVATRKVPLAVAARAVAGAWKVVNSW